MKRLNVPNVNVISGCILTIKYINKLITVMYCVFVSSSRGFLFRWRFKSYLGFIEVDFV